MLNRQFFIVLFAAAFLLSAAPQAAALNLDSSNALKIADSGSGIMNFTAKKSLYVDEIRFQTNAGANEAILLKVNGVTLATVPAFAYASNTYYTINGFNVTVPKNSYFTMESNNVATLNFKAKNDGTYTVNSWIGDVNAVSASFSSGFSAPNSAYIRVGEGFRDDGITFYSTDLDTGSAINDFTINLYDNNSILLITNSTTNGLLYFNLSSYGSGNYTAFYNSSGYLNLNYTFNYTDPIGLVYTFNTISTPNLNLFFRDELTKSLLTNINYSLIFDDIATQATSNDGSTDYILLNSTGLLEIEYQKTGYPLRHYYLNITPQTNTSLDLYLLNDGNATEINYLITDQAGVGLENAYISLLRRYVIGGVPVFEVVEIAKSNNEGEGSIYVEKNTATYKFLASYEDELILSTSPAQIFQNSIVLKGTVGESVTQSLYAIQGLQHSLTYAGNLFTLSWSDTTGILEEMCLNVYRTRSGSRVLFNDTCSTANAGSISLGVDNSTNGEYLAVAVVDTTTQFSEHILATLAKKIDDLSQTIGVSGIFYAALLVITAGTIAVFSPVAAILLTVAALIFSSLIGFVSISMPVLFLITAVGGVLLYAFRRGGA